MKPLPLSALANTLKIHHPHQVLVKGVAIDSRKVEPGDLFFALPGNRVDGQDYLRDAAMKGAVAAVVKNDFNKEAWGLSLLRVPDVLASLQELAHKTLMQRTSKVIAITGSLGKTTTKGFVAHLLSTRYSVFASPLSYNSQSTVPLSILMADGTEDFLILEMGMTHEGNIQNLISIAPPDIALITTLALQHANNFADGLAGISREKAQIFSHPKTAWGLLPCDVLYYKEVSAIGACLKKTFSTSRREADYFLETIPQGARMHFRGEFPFELALNLPMSVHNQNFLAAAALARNLDIPWTFIRDVAPYLKLPGMRFEKLEKQGIVFINDAYNANPDAMKAALENLPKPQTGGKVIAVLGEMDALGAYTEEGHLHVAETALSTVDQILCIGLNWQKSCELWSAEKKPYTLFESRFALKDSLVRLAKPGDVVLLKGARSQALDLLLEAF